MIVVEENLVLAHPKTADVEVNKALPALTAHAQSLEHLAVSEDLDQRAVNRMLLPRVTKEEVAAGR